MIRTQNKMVKKIFISTSTFGKYDSTPLRILKSSGFGFFLNPHGRTLKSNEIIELISEAIGLIAGIEDLNEEILNRLPKLKVISRCGSGIENINLDAAKKLGIIIKNTPEPATIAVAELVICMILTLLRDLHNFNKETHEGKWNKKMGYLLTGKKVGIIGFGRIGKMVAHLLKPFNTKIYYYDPYIKSEKNNTDCKNIHKILKNCDVISLHVPKTNETFHLIGKKEIKMMKKSAVLINCARGGIVDEIALYEALKNKEIFGAALDVCESEPYSGELINLDNVLLTPHIGSYAIEARVKMEIEAVKNIISVLKNI